MKPYEQEAPLTTGLNYRPAEMYTPWKAVVVPLAQSLSLGVIVMGVFSSSRLVYMYPGEWWSWGLAVSALVVLYQYLSGIGFWHWVIKNIELVTQTDWDNDEKIADEPIRPPLLVNVVKGNETKRIELPYPERMPDFARGLLLGKAPTYAVWVSNTSAWKLFSAGEFKNVIEKFRANGWLDLINARDVSRGYKLSDEGKQVMKRIAHSPADSPAPYFDPRSMNG